MLACVGRAHAIGHAKRQPLSASRRSIYRFAYFAVLASLPFIAIYAHSVLPTTLTYLFFFSTQLLFPYEGLVTRDTSGSHFVFSHRVGLLITFIHWGLIAGAFTWVARRLPMRHAIFAAIGTIVLVGIATHVVFGVFGVSVELDGP